MLYVIASRASAQEFSVEGIKTLAVKQSRLLLQAEHTNDSI